MNTRKDRDPNPLDGNPDNDKDPRPGLPATPQPDLGRGYGDEHGGYLIDAESEGDPDARPGPRDDVERAAEPIPSGQRRAA